jgi:hypothetical protein
MGAGDEGDSCVGIGRAGVCYPEAHAAVLQDCVP